MLFCFYILLLFKYYEKLFLIIFGLENFNYLVKIGKCVFKTHLKYKYLNVLLCPSNKFKTKKYTTNTFLENFIVN